MIKNFKSLYGFGGRFVKIRDVWMDFESYFKVHNLVSVHPKSIILSQMTNLNMIFHVVVSVYRLVKIWNMPQLAPVPWWSSERPMTRERGSLAESKNCEILLFPTAERRFGTKVKCPTGRASF